PMGGAPLTCLAFGRDERVLVTGDQGGQTRVLDLDSGQSFPWFSTDQAVTCGYDPASDEFTFLDAKGAAWTRTLDATPLAFLPKVQDPLDPRTRPLAEWPGLERRDGDRPGGGLGRAFPRAIR